jgi:hypothetical protein
MQHPVEPGRVDRLAWTAAVSAAHLRAPLTELVVLLAGLGSVGRRPWPDTPGSRGSPILSNSSSLTGHVVGAGKGGRLPIVSGSRLAASA